MHQFWNVAVGIVDNVPLYGLLLELNSFHLNLVVHDFIHHN